MNSKSRLAVVVSHPIQYYAPLFRTLARRCELEVFYAFQPSPDQLGAVDFGKAFSWDVDLLEGYSSTFLTNVSTRPGTSDSAGCDTPEIGRHLRDGNFDAVLIFGWYLKSYRQALLAAKRHGLPALVRGDSNLAMPASPVKRLAKAIANPPFLRLFDRALYVGERSRAFYRHYRYPDCRLFFSPHCVDNDWFAARTKPAERQRMREELGIADDAFVVLFAGKLIKRKRPLDAVKALAMCQTQGRKVALLVAGSGVLENAIRTEAQAAGLPHYMLGFCNQTEMPPAYAASDVLILPSDGSETWGLVANEAMACGKPVIVSDACGCAPDLAADGAAGRMVAVGDVAGLAAAIVSVMDDPPTQWAIAERIAHYSLDSAADGVLQALETLPRRHRPLKPVGNGSC
ncbi:glycosyltransferase family 4 protein [Aurantiacibacter luteus]|uniref:Glycosyl transferase family 1 domain-containing protein n=1 Tax=Aurantiacibacter luteus TaxID=1581420 RepID=A0A0G9MY33_9SPHN|nr:glycosyltransferase family 4 protein [Aurantiacibacter luteus]KLE35682.1 hypothetical protein AAW00_04605 [Aurantiacibacter luteus]